MFSGRVLTNLNPEFISQQHRQTDIRREREKERADEIMSECVLLA